MKKRKEEKSGWVNTKQTSLLLADIFHKQFNVIELEAVCPYIPVSGIR